MESIDQQMSDLSIINNGITITNNIISAEDMIKAIKENLLSISFDCAKTQNDAQYITTKLLVNDEKVHKISFTNTRFYPPREFQNDTYPNSQAIISGFRKQQFLSDKNYPWKFQGNTILFDFLDIFTDLLRCELQKQISQLKKSFLDKKLFKIIQQENSVENSKWKYTIKIDGYSTNVSAQFFQPKIVKTDNSSILTEGNQIPIKTKKEFQQTFGHQGFLIARGFIQMDRIYLKGSTIMAAAFKLTKAIIAFAPEENIQIENDISRSIYINEAFAAMITESQQSLQINDTSSNNSDDQSTDNKVDNHDQLQQQILQQIKQ